jgi:RNA polymerase sigma factor (sigma-70 family)
VALRTPRKAIHWRAADRRLAALAAAGDEAAFEAIFERHHHGVLSLCKHLLGSLEEGEDAVQHTFAAAFRQLVEREPPEHLRAWLYATARNRCMDVLRARHELPRELSCTSTAGLSEEVERRSDLRELVDDVGRLPEDQRVALVLSEVEGLTHAEVAEILGCTREKVRALVYQARSSLAGWREARALPCRNVREELAVARGAALRRGHLRRHLRLCRGCAAFREDMERQRRGLAVVLPVTPTLALRERALGAAAEAARAGGGAAVTGASAGAGGGLVGSAAIKVGAGAALLLSGGAAAFGGFPELGPLATAPAGAPNSERAAASGPGPALVQQAVDPKRTSKQLWERTVAAVAASLDARRLDETLPALPKTPEAELPSAGPVPEELPEALTLPAPQAPALPAPQAPAAPQPVPEVPEAPAAPQPVPEVPEAPAAPQPELPSPDGGALPEVPLEVEPPAGVR